MFGGLAVKLLKLMGRSGKVPGAIMPEDIPAALQQLKAALSEYGTQIPQDRNEEQKEPEKFIDEPVSLPTRAVPLIELLERSLAEDVGVMWEEQ
jgi:hypothetical protein